MSLPVCGFHEDPHIGCLLLQRLYELLKYRLCPRQAVAGSHCFCAVNSPFESDGSTAIEPLMDVAGSCRAPA
jgi:hypothetical protein